jgi:hypothetical protein
MRKKNKRWWLIILIIIILVLAVRLYFQGNKWVCVDGEWIAQGKPKTEKPLKYCSDKNVSNFKECVAAGNPVMESYPRQCMHENQTFKEVIENFCTEEDGGDLCTTLYEPVCGYPLKETFSNSCFACQNSEVIYWVPGECL